MQNWLYKWQIEMNHSNGNHPTYLMFFNEQNMGPSGACHKYTSLNKKLIIDLYLNDHY